MKKICRIAAILLSVSLFLGAAELSQNTSIRTELLPKLPEWKPSVIERHAEGNPALVVFFEEGENDVLHPVKRLTFYLGGKVREETDLIEVVETDPAYKIWHSLVVPHGVSVEFFETGQVKALCYYDHGLLEGTASMYFSDGKPEKTIEYKKGLREGQEITYYENGVKAKEASYAADLLNGDSTTYYQSGNQMSQSRYASGVLEGKVTSLYESGALKSVMNYSKGKLHSGANLPAVMAYNEKNAIIEVQDFKEGSPVGLHIKYYSNGRESYKAPYIEGMLHGKVQYFDQEGALIGDGRYENGKPVGKHWQNHDKQTLASIANYSPEGVLLEPIKEYDVKGKLVKQYFLVDGKYEGEYKTWLDGKALIAYQYKQGELEGAQLEQYPSGQIKIKANYVNHEKDGLFSEFYEDGSPSLKVTYQKGKKEGALLEWYPNKQMKKQWFFKDNAFDGVQTQWYDNGKEKMRISYVAGKRNGPYQMWDEAGELTVSAAYKQDQMDGLFESFYSKNKPKEKSFFKEDKLEGKYESFYENGKMAAESFYVGHLLDGESKGWFEDGTLHYIRHFDKGVPIGKQEEFYPKDKWVDYKKPQLSRIFVYDDKGKLNGEQKTFYPNGVLQTLLSYEAGELHGMKGFWDEGGNLVEESYLEKGRLQGRFFERDKEGKEVVYHYKDNKKEGPYIIYYPYHESFGKVKALEACYKNNKLEGDVIEYDQAGNVGTTTPYVNGVKEGIAKLFNGQDKVAMIVPFQNNKREGISFQYFPNGKIYKETPYVNDLKEGTEKTFFADGTLENIYEYHMGNLNGAAKTWTPKGILIFEGFYKEGKREGHFNKYYEDGKPFIQQIYSQDLLDGVKKVYGKDGTVTQTHYQKGQKLAS